MFEVLFRVVVKAVPDNFKSSGAQFVRFALHSTNCAIALPCSSALPLKDSNLEREIQNLLCYHYTKGQSQGAAWRSDNRILAGVKQTEKKHLRGLRMALASRPAEKARLRSSVGRAEDS